MNVVLAEWCFALNYVNAIPVWEYTFYPKEYLYLKLESMFNKFAKSSKLINYYLFFFLKIFIILKGLGAKMFY